MGTASQPTQPSISIYKDAKGTVLRVMESIGTCKVQEIAFSRKIELTSECKGGTVFMGDVTEVLREGDAVFLDYVVGLNGTREEVCCDLVWHGRRPRGAWQMSPEEFGQRLQIDTQDAENSLRFEDFESEICSRVHFVAILLSLTWKLSLGSKQQTSRGGVTWSLKGALGPWAAG